MLRFDTRVYLQPCDRPRGRDRAIGCIVGKNPGSATPACITGDLQPIILQGDRFLPTVRAIVRKAYEAAAQAPPAGAYVQILNLFYLCNRNLAQAKRGFAELEMPPLCTTERKRFPWQWFAWGGPDPMLDPLKDRYLGRRAKEAFFLSGASKRVHIGKPGPGDHARHTQGMRHEPVVRYLSKQIA